LLRASAVAGATVALDGCGSSHKRPKPIDTVADRDVELLNQALHLERRAIAAYTAGIPLLGRATHGAAIQFLNQELAHAGMLIAMIKQAGGPQPRRPSTYNLGEPSNSRQVLALLEQVEQAQIDYYLVMVGQLSAGPMRAAIGSIVSDDAQHVSILLAAQGKPAAPSAFLAGAG
jgi:rubrerythrin